MNTNKNGAVAYTTPQEKGQSKDTKLTALSPAFDTGIFGKADPIDERIKANAEKADIITQVKHSEIFDRLLEQIKPVNYREEAALSDETERLGKKHYIVITVEKVLQTARANNWSLCRNHDFVYAYNSAYWDLVEDAQLQTFLGEAAEKMGVDRFDARHYLFREQLLKQFIAIANLPKPELKSGTVLMNLLNGTLEIGAGKPKLRLPDRKDFIKYQLPFRYDETAAAPLFRTYLERVLPKKELQDVLAEYIAYVFVSPSTLKLEKCLLVYGTGANGKSVLFEIVNALLGKDNVSTYPLQSLTDESGYYRAMIANKLLNYASEINGKLETNVFKQLASGEPVTARLPYGTPMTITEYAKMIFNCNELPKDVEQTNAFYRRFIIIPFDQTIPEHEQDKELSKKIIDNELSGVFNWVMEGLNRLLTQKNFTHSEIVQKQVEDYRKFSDSVRMFLEDEGYEPSTRESEYVMRAEIFKSYKDYCYDNNFRPCSTKNFGDRLKAAGFDVQRKNVGNVVYAKKVVFNPSLSTLPTPKPF